MNNHDLDNLIRESLPAEPSREQLARLEDYWREQSKAIRLEGRSRLRRASPATYWVAVVATTVLVAVATSLCLWRPEPTREPIATKHLKKVESALPVNQHNNQTELIVATESQPKDDTLSAGRPPTNYERILFIAATRKSVTVRQSAAAAKINQAIEEIEDVDRLAQLAAHTDDRRVRAKIYQRLLNADSEPALRGYLCLVRCEILTAEALAAANVVSGPLLERLLGLLKDDDEGVRLAAAMVLGHANGPEVAAALIELVTAEIDRQSSPAEVWNPTEAWIAIMACRGRQTEEFLSYVQCHPKLLGQYNRALARLAQITL